MSRLVAFFDVIKCFCVLFFYQAQMELRDRRVWSLRGLLGIAGNLPRPPATARSTLNLGTRKNKPQPTQRSKTQRW
jgi:hypothetical protein